jgi:carboxyl-terminal processing protease
MTTLTRRTFLTFSASLLLPPAAHADIDSLRRFDQVWRTVRDRFYDPNLHGINWDAAAKRWRPKAEKAASLVDLQSVMNEMLAELRASHLHYAVADDFDFWLLKTVFTPNEGPVTVPHIGVQGAREGGAFVVRALLEGGPAWKSGLRFGDRILGTDKSDRPFTTVGSFRAREGQTVQLKVDRPGEGEVKIDVRPVMETPVEAYSRAISRSARIVEKDGKRLGYVHLWGLANREWLRAFDEAILRKLIDTDGLVLDLRDGYGGNPDHFDYSLFRPEIAMTTIPRKGNPSTQKNGYGRPLVVLINGGSRSAKEYFAYELKKTGRGTLVGTRTMGAFLGAGGFPIADDGLLMLPVLDLKLDGVRLEGAGITPEIVVEANDAYSPQDRQVARGFEVLIDKIKAISR